MKRKRQAKILQLIEEYSIETQEELQEYLSACGFPVTQATVSRDIRELKLMKIVSELGKYKYAKPAGSLERERRFQAIFTTSVRCADYAMNTVVLKCEVGTAQAACASFDTMDFSDVVGTLAGDDTVFILLRSESSASDLCRYLQKQLSGRERHAE